MLQTAAFKALSEHVADRLHDSVTADAAAAERHRGFVLTHVVVGAAPFAALPALLAFAPASSAVGFAAFGWLVLPLLAALDLTRSGRLDRAAGLAAAAYVGLAALVAAATGGVASPAVALLALPAADAALSGARRAGRFALGLAGAAFAGLAAFSLSGVAGPVMEPALAVVAGGAFGLYALALALRTAGLARALERAEAPSDERFALFADGLDDLVTRHAPSGAATFVSRASRDVIGANARDLAGQGLFERVHIADRPAYLRALAAAVDGAPAEAEIRLRRGPAEAPAFGWFSMRARPALPHEANAAAFAAAPVVAMFRDLGDSKAHEAALTEACQEAERASLAKTRFLAHMSHELRTPLNAIIGFSEILSDETLCRLTPERRSDYAALIHRSGAHLLEVVNSILDMTRIESGAFAISPRACALEPLVEHCLKLMELKAGTAGVSLHADLDPAAAEIEADPRAVTQMLINLVANAIKFTPRGGEVRIALAPRGEGVALSVRDTGCGIAPEHVGRLGEAFFQGDAAGRPQEGAGLGLSVVRGLVALHGGEFAVSSVLGRGTSVDVFLPRRPGSVRPLRAPVFQHSVENIPAEKVKRRA
ncbi:sensor histidine kinase [Chenggangzhangella methanolivorans]|uniref:histidine kinase n=1 Tax=Chenggangzhangella methanolivorans TaxID=1437009 RepID=A0A9E6RAW4_9HYPH|nr:PAS domain-containing protein [Chenggangzhangella methanolivorans]QZO00822.1 PAS domain-containing sensor histidine kinase [Chenggangzhangella methanolivorans]